MAMQDESRKYQCKTKYRSETRELNKRRMKENSRKETVIKKKREMIPGRGKKERRVT